MGINDALITVNKGIAYPQGLLNRATYFLKQLLDPQMKNTFEMLLYPADISSTSMESIAHAGLDTSVVKLHLQTLSAPFGTLESELADDRKYISTFTRPDQVVFTFLENDLAFVRNYYALWQDLVYFRDNKGRLIFRDNQQGARKNAKIFLQTGLGIPSPGWINLNGLVPKGLNELEVGHDSTEPYVMIMTCAVDDVWLETATNTNLF